jgi:hypothetical protein
MRKLKIFERISLDGVKRKVAIGRRVDLENQLGEICSLK